MINVRLLYNTPLKIADIAIGTCWDKQRDDDVIDLERMDRVANKFKHASTIEHVTYNFYIKGISRALLQELARHRMANISVKSTRYTLKELKDFKTPIDFTLDFDKFLVSSGNIDVDICSWSALLKLKTILENGTSNDRAKYCLPEAYKTELTWTINARSLQNFLHLRTAKAALWEIRDLANELYSVLPEDHKFLFKGYINE